MRRLLLAMIPPIALTAIVAAEPNRAEVERIGGLISQLGSGNYRERLEAFRSLDVIGETALEKLRIATKSPDMETAHRATELVRRIEHRMNSVRILTAKLVDVDIVDKAVPDAVREFQAKTGLPVTLNGDTSRLGKRKVTYKSGQVNVWEALAGFCKAANLTEWNGLAPIPGLPTPNVATEARNNPIFLPQGQFVFRSTVRSSSNGTASQVFLYDESPANIPTHHAGAVRLRALPAGTPIPNMTANADEVIIPLQVTLEPRLSWSGAPSIKIGQATDDRDQRLPVSIANLSTGGQHDDDFMVMQLMGAGYGTFLPQRSQYVALRMQQGDKPSKGLKELSGSLSLPLKVSGPLIVANDPLKLVGQTVRAPYGSMTILAAERNEAGVVKVDVSMELALEVQMPMFNPAAGNRIAMMPNVQVQIQNGMVVQNVNGGQQNLGAGVSEYMGLSLSDSAGKRWNATQVTHQQMNYDPTGCKARISLLFRPINDAADAARLVFTASHPAVVETDFRFADLPLP